MVKRFHLHFHMIHLVLCAFFLHSSLILTYDFLTFINKHMFNFYLRSRMITYLSCDLTRGYLGKFQGMTWWNAASHITFISWSHITHQNPAELNVHIEPLFIIWFHYLSYKSVLDIDSLFPAADKKQNQKRLYRCNVPKISKTSQQNW